MNIESNYALFVGVALSLCFGLYAGDKGHIPTLRNAIIDMIEFTGKIKPSAHYPSLLVKRYDDYKPKDRADALLRYLGRQENDFDDDMWASRLKSQHFVPVACAVGVIPHHLEYAQNADFELFMEKNVYAYESAKDGHCKTILDCLKASTSGQDLLKLFKRLAEGSHANCLTKKRFDDFLVNKTLTPLYWDKLKGQWTDEQYSDESYTINFERFK